MLENAGAVMSERTLQWDMSKLFPGEDLCFNYSEGNFTVGKKETSVPNFFFEVEMMELVE